MARLNVGRLLLRPTFTSKIKLIKRKQIISDKGRTELVDDSCCWINAVVQDKGPQVLNRTAEMAYLTDQITVIYRGELSAQRYNGYADVLEWKGKRYEVKNVSDDFLNYGKGFTKAQCLLIGTSVN